MILLCSSCGKTTTEKKHAIKVDFSNSEQVSVFDYFKSIELIPLETNDDVIIGDLRKIIYYQDRYYTFDAKQHIINVFDTNGKFIFKIAKRGQGPGEYPSLEDININNAGNLELLCPYGFIYEYDLLGKFIKQTRISSDYIHAVHGLISLDKNIRVFFAAGHHPYRAIYYDVNEKKILREEFEEHDILGSTFCYDSFYQYNGDYYFYRPCCLDVYKVGKEKFEISYTWDLGEFNRDIKKAHFSEEAKKNAYKSFEEIEEQFPYYFSIMGENNKYVIAYGKINGKFVSIIYNKSDQKSWCIDKFTESISLLPIIVSNEYVLSRCNPDEMNQYLTESMLDETNKKIFNDLKNSDDNPVIIKYYFK
jgi:hypothetical protein